MTGAAVGAGISAVAGLAIPVLGSILPFGVVAGTLLGLLVKELGQRDSKQSVNGTPKPA
jgi:uncharacterized protein YqgC (DUF456 family)